jgi:glycosyltransferase involved in cell wall biosynthesis
MRIGVDARLAGPGLGVGTMVRSLANGLIRLGVEVVWFGEAMLAPERVAEVVVPPAPGFAGLDSPRGRSLVAGQRLDLMHFTANSGWWGKGPVPHVLTVHDVIWSRTSVRGRRPRQAIGHGYLRFAVPRAIRSAAAVAVPSGTTAAAVLRRYGTRTEVIYNGVAESWRRAGARSMGEPYLVAFSGRDPRKGTEVALETWSRVAARGVRLVLLAGAGLPPGLRSELAEPLARGQVEVLPYQSVAALTEIVAGAVALLYPSSEEGFGLPVAEAMAAGVPVITGLTPVTLEIGGDAILALDPRDPAGYAVRHVERLLGDPELRAELAARGRERAAGFTWAAAAERYREMYEHVLAR